jgi:CRISPR-associated exonuclease Cas4
MNVEPVVQLSAIEHWAYCPRQCGLIHVDGVWADNEHTARGVRAHRRVDSGVHGTQRGVRILRSIPLWSEVFGLSGRADAVELHPSGEVVPVEYKSGVPHGDAALLQLAAQALCLEEMLGVVVERGAIWYGGLRRRVWADLDGDVRRRTLAVVKAIRETIISGKLPNAVDDERCSACQLVSYCLPSVVVRASEVASYWEGVFRCGT